ncbi:hypothetical protein ASA1KI_32460 [Opitutales bacterium ASA1]|uniref:glycosylase n=1 Tax=Congregicoccus parvus TaxID=3081749 RepID=UPI002B311807|nr:hypothetical protein ASA1KI_32460 [Opitutales bacterium ASA1]
MNLRRLGRLPVALALVPLFVGAADRPAVVPVTPDPSVRVPDEVMQRVFDEVKTPYKYGVVVRGEENELVDCPNVFRREGTWYMLYAANRDKIGYQTFLARSDDLLTWEKLGPVLSFSKQGWDAWQADAGLSLYDTDWPGTHEIRTHDGKYWMTYIGGALQGYETDPLSIGIATTTTPHEPREWTRLPQNPILSPEQSDVRWWETSTLYKSAVIHDPAETLGWPFVMYYNAKFPPDGNEFIGMAVSRDMVSWIRYGDDPVIRNKGTSRWAISGDPQIARIGEVWVMFYFGAFWKPNAFDTFACSYDLVNWTKWEGPHLVEPSEPWDKQFAHKPWLLKHDGVVYHFYCAVGDQGRVIALATSKDLRAKPAAE